MISYGTGTPVPKVSISMKLAIINQIIQTKVCIEFVEINPLLDTKGNKNGRNCF
jgi:arginase